MAAPRMLTSSPCRRAGIPWYASWDLAFHCVHAGPSSTRNLPGPANRLTLLVYASHRPVPAYEWNFGDVNPPVHAWSAWRVFEIDRKRNGHAGDFAFLEGVFHKLLLNFTWWVNRKDAQNRNIFQGGFLGLDNIGVIDRDQPLPGGGYLDQADGTSWMAMYCLNLLRIALALAVNDPVYQEIATKFFEHFLQIAETMSGMETFDGKSLGLWDNEDEFYYDAVTCLTTGAPLKVCSPAARSAPRKH